MNPRWLELSEKLFPVAEYRDPEKLEAVVGVSNEFTPGDLSTFRAFDRATELDMKKLESLLIERASLRLDGAAKDALAPIVELQVRPSGELDSNASYPTIATFEPSKRAGGRAYEVKIHQEAVQKAQALFREGKFDLVPTATLSVGKGKPPPKQGPTINITITILAVGVMSVN